MRATSVSRSALETPASRRPKRRFPGRFPRQQCIVLKHHAALGARSCDLAAVYRQASVVGLTKPAIRFKSVVLAASRLTDNDGEAAVLQVERDVAQYLHGFLVFPLAGKMMPTDFRRIMSWWQC